MRLPGHAAATAPSPPGFTLLELLVTISLGSLVISALLSLLLGQGRFYRHADDSILARQSAGALTDLMSSELRLARAADLLAAEPESVSVRLDILLGVVCDSTAADEVALYWYDSVPAANLPGGLSGTSYSLPLAPGVRHADGWRPLETASGAGVKAICEAGAAPLIGPDSNYRIAAGWAGSFGGDFPAPGSLVRQYGTLTYRVAPSRFGDGDALWRNRQEIVAPLRGVTLAYEKDDGTVVASVPPADLERVRRIRLEGEAQGLSAAVTGAARPLSISIPLLGQ
ncbi:MAG: prepilin-type N-terminal cleavage/methylation domain-containing protein [Gemmatimonadota bacterium]